MSSAVCLNLDQSKILSSGYELSLTMSDGLLIKITCQWPSLGTHMHWSCYYLCMLFFFKFIFLLNCFHAVYLSHYFCLITFPFYTPVEDRTYYGINHGGRAGGFPHSLSGAYLQDYASYGYEISWVDRSH